MSAGAFTAGFSAAVFPASAQLRTITVTLLGGETVTVQVDTPPDAATTGADALPAASTSTSDASATTDAAAGADDAGRRHQLLPHACAARGHARSDARDARARRDRRRTAPGPERRHARRHGDDSVPALGDSAPSVSAGGQQGQETVGKELRKATGDDADKSQSDGKPDATAIRQADGVPTSANPTFSQASPAPRADRRPELLHRQVPDPAVPAPDLPGRRHRVRHPLGGPGGHQRDRDRLRPQPQRLLGRRAGLDAVHAGHVEAVRRRRQPRRQEGPLQPRRRDLRGRALPQGRRRRPGHPPARSSPTTTPTGTSTRSSCAPA